MPKVRVAPSIGELERTFETAWGLETYDPVKDIHNPTVFVGIYGLPDFFALWKHKGTKWIFWCGSDIRHLQKGYWLDEDGQITIENHGLSRWINKNCESWVENTVEQKALKNMGITSRVCPSFLGDVNAFPISYRYSTKPKLYASVSGDDFSLYRWPDIVDIAHQFSNIEFHLYGNTKEFKVDVPNVIVHGRVPKEQMNLEISTMQGAIRLLRFDGFSEIIAKSLLMGQWPVSIIPYTHTVPLFEITRLTELDLPNIQGRDYYLNKLNKFPWVKK